MKKIKTLFIACFFLSIHNSYGFWGKLEKRLEAAVCLAHQQEQFNTIKKQVEAFLDACDPNFGSFYLFDFLDVQYFKTLAQQALQEQLSANQEALIAYTTEKTEWSQFAEEIIKHYIQWLETHPDCFISFNGYLKVIFLCNYKELLEYNKKTTH